MPGGGRRNIIKGSGSARASSSSKTSSSVSVAGQGSRPLLFNSGRGGSEECSGSSGPLPPPGFPSQAQISIPELPSDGPLQFEIIIFAYSFVALLLQYLHLYRTVWWLPHSYNAYAMNFYLIDINLIYFSAIVLGRRVIWTILRMLITGLVPHHWIQSVIIVTRSITTFVVLSTLLVIAYVIVHHHPVVNILYLAYPVSVYFLLFGLSGEPFLELTPTTTGKIRIIKDKSGMYRTSTFSANFLPPPETTRAEVAVLKSDFNMRIKQVLFNSIISAYYSAFVPCCFTPSALHYEVGWVGRHVMLVWVGCFTLYVVQCFPSSYNHMMHRSALQLGLWTKIEGRVSANFYSQWVSNSISPYGAIVRFGKDLYKAEGVANAAEPGNTSQARFYGLFKDPSMAICGLLVVQSGLILAQHLSLTWSTYWYQLISEAILLFANYYVLFKLARDYLILSKVYFSDNGSAQLPE